MKVSRQGEKEEESSTGLHCMTPLFLDMHIFTLDVLVIDSSSLIKRGRVG